MKTTTDAPDVAETRPQHWAQSVSDYLDRWVARARHAPYAVTTTLCIVLAVGDIIIAPFELYAQCIFAAGCFCDGVDRALLILFVIRRTASIVLSARREQYDFAHLKSVIALFRQCFDADDTRKMA